MSLFHPVAPQRLRRALLASGLALPFAGSRNAHASAGEKILVVLELSGGNDGLNTVVPYADETYYRLLAEFCDWGIAAGAQDGYAEIGTASTTERGRMDALGVIEVTPIGFEPLLNGQSPAERVPKLLRAECALGVLRNAIDQILEPAP